MNELISVKYLVEIQEQREYYMNELVYSQELNTVEHASESQFYKMEMRII